MSGHAETGRQAWLRAKWEFSHESSSLSGRTINFVVYINIDNESIGQDSKISFVKKDNGIANFEIADIEVNDPEVLSPKIEDQNPFEKSIDQTSIDEKKNRMIHLKEFNYSFNKNDTTSERFQSAYVLDHLEQNFSIIASQIINKKIRIDWRATYQDRAGGYTEFNSGLEIEYLPFWLIGSKVTYEFSKDKLIYCEVHNLLDETYVDFGNIPQPKRWIRGGIKFIF